MAAGHLARVEDDRPRDVFDQPALDLPDQFLALLRVRLHRLLFDQIIDLGIAVAGVVALRAADVILVELLIRVVDPSLGDIEPDNKIAARQRRIPLCGVECIEHPVDIDLL